MVLEAQQKIKTMNEKITYEQLKQQDKQIIQSKLYLTKDNYESKPERFNNFAKCLNAKLEIIDYEN